MVEELSDGGQQTIVVKRDELVLIVSKISDLRKRSSFSSWFALVTQKVEL